ncbi:ABC transporter ATP-binding protein/permease [Trichothermofontia sichuanensis B231]|nr:ABC transporter ATP-binding protein [Trichothermofontia sichuanensis]UZQ55053.1 ABC transporter ATP-binding protein/permease [Trichothermofontia sichuanensis B231]
MDGYKALPSSQKSENDWQLFLRLVPYVRRSLRPFVVSMLLLIPLSAAGAVQPILIGQAISLIRQDPVMGFLAGKSLNAGLNWVISGLLVTVVVRLLLGSVQGYLVQRVGQEITAEIRDDLFDHVTSLAMAFFDRTPVGRLITRLTSDVEALGDVFSTGAIGIVSDLFAVLAIVIAMFFSQWLLALMLCIFLLPVSYLILYFQRQYRQANYRARDELSALNSMLQENIMGIGVVQLFRREKLNADLFRNTNQKYIREVDKTIFHDSAVSATLEWISLVAIAGVLGLGSLLVIQGQLTFGVLSSFILFSQRLFDPLRRFAEKFTMLQSGFTAVERIRDLLNEPIAIRDPEPLETGLTNHPSLKSSVSGNFPLWKSGDQRGEIRFEHVSFAYKAGDYVLKDLNFTIQPGEKVALVGPTGAGKSSIIRLLCRLYEPTAGRILIDGIDIRDLRQQDLRRYLGVILQDGFLFTGDVSSNIALGEPYSEAEIRAAAEQTNVAAFIERLPQGYATPLRERGTNLSAGQKQLLSFARVAIRNPEILVLDEATANLDVHTEFLIQAALDRLMVDRTAIIIAHRLSTIRSVDRILVLKHGQLVESGDHETLLAQGGLYASLYYLQQLGH